MFSVNTNCLLFNTLFLLLTSSYQEIVLLAFKRNHQDLIGELLLLDSKDPFGGLEQHLTYTSLLS